MTFQAVMVCHNKAMDLAEQALLAQRRGDGIAAGRFFRKAFALEKAAAETFAELPDYEPTRSILYRSAAALAVDIGAHSEARRLAGTALAGSPPREIAEEIKGLLNQIEDAE